MNFMNEDDFYMSLWLDFLEAKGRGDASECFYYQYSEKEKSQRSEEAFQTKEQLMEYKETTQKMDKYHFFHGAFFLYEEKKLLTEKEFTDIFKGLLANNDGNADNYAGLMKKDLHKAALEFQKEILTGSAADFFSKRGFSFKTGSRKKSMAAKKSYKDMIEMTYEYNRYLEVNKSSSGKEEEIGKNPGEGSDTPFTANPGRGIRVSAEYKKKCAKLFRLALGKKGMDDDVVPLYFDLNSGAGIYILGKSVFEDIDDSGSGLEENCAVCILSFAFPADRTAYSISSDTDSDDVEDDAKLFDLSMQVRKIKNEKKEVEKENENGVLVRKEVIDVSKTIRNAFYEFENSVNSSYVYFKGYTDSHNFAPKYFTEGRIDEFFIPRMVRSEDVKGIREAILASQKKKEEEEIETIKSRKEN